MRPISWRVTFICIPSGVAVMASGLFAQVKQRAATAHRVHIEKGQVTDFCAGACAAFQAICRLRARNRSGSAWLNSRNLRN